MTTGNHGDAQELLQAVLHGHVDDAESNGTLVLIAGGGIGGLALALAVARRGIPSHILERRTAFSEEGAGIQIGPNGTRVLRDLGVAEALRPHVGIPNELVVHDGRSATALTRMPLGRHIEQRFGAPYWVSHREDLHAALLTAARAQPLIRISMGCDVAAAGSTAATAAAVTANGRAFSAPVLVGADGLRSQVRRAVAGREATLTTTGKSAFRAIVASERLPPSLRDGATHIWLMPDAHVVHYPVRGGSETAIILIAADAAFAGEGWSHVAEAGALIARLPLAADLRATLQAASSWRKWALVAPDASWPLAAGRIALTGDAAHPVLPFLAQGGVLALEDAVVLAEHLTRDSSDIATSLAAYAEARRARVARVAAASRRNGEIYHLRGAARIARDAVMRLAPPARLLARYDWIYGWS